MKCQQTLINYLNKRGQDNLKIKLKDFETLNFFNFITALLHKPTDKALFRNIIRK